MRGAGRPVGSSGRLAADWHARGRAGTLVSTRVQVSGEDGRLGALRAARSELEGLGSLGLGGLVDSVAPIPGSQLVPRAPERRTERRRRRRSSRPFLELNGGGRCPSLAWPGPRLRARVTARPAPPAGSGRWHAFNSRGRDAPRGQTGVIRPHPAPPRPANTFSLRPGRVWPALCNSGWTECLWLHWLHWLHCAARDPH